MLLLASLVALAGCSRSTNVAAAAPESNEDLLLGKPYSGAAAPAPRGADGRPLLTGYWKVLRDPGKPDGNLAKDQPGQLLPYSARGEAALEYNLTRTIDPEARCLITGIPR